MWWLRTVMGLPFADRWDPMRRRGLFEGDGTGSGGGGDKSGGGDGKGNDGGSGNDPKPITFPDEASLMRRINQGSRQELEKAAKDLGFDSVDAMKAAAKAKKAADEANKSELEKEKTAREKAENDSKAALEKANQRLINAEIKLAAQAAGFVDPGDAVALVGRSGISIDDKESIIGVKEAVEALAKAKPHLIGKGKPDGSPGGAGNGSRQDGSGGNQAGEYGKQLAAKRAEEAKKRSEGQVNYFK